jgi:hypothetical protein
VEEEQELGTKAEYVGGASTGSMFVTEVDPMEALELGSMALEDGEFALAAKSLQSIDIPFDEDFPIGEYYVRTTYALLGIGDFSEAIRTAFDSYGVDPDPEYAARLDERLQLLVAIAAYYSDDDTMARAAATSYVDSLGVEQADPRGIAIAILLEQSPARARDLERQARAAHSEQDWDALLERGS